ncbi:hypothetical protein [Vibrio tubiashii]|uniref:hypothetical protein n=1 Tax=Vibrio tubiashii TaxID=29498 RepID=UPI00349E8C53
MVRKIFVAAVVILSFNAHALCRSGNEITDAVEGAIAGGVVGAIAGDATTGAAIGATVSVIDGAYQDVECEEAIGDELVAGAIEDEYESEMIESAIVEDALVN